MSSAATIRVWDPLVRFGHWGLVAAFATAYLTEGEPEWLHVWSGYAIAAIVAVRIVWGIIGPRHARFSDFVTGPVKATRYLIALIRGKAERHIGHSPAGGLMVLALLASLSVTAVSGMALYAAEEGRGPLSSIVAVQGEGAAAPSAYGDDDDDEYGEGREETVWEEVHEVAANLTLALIVLHVGGVLLASLSHHENLARAMVTGRKQA